MTNNSTSAVLKVAAPPAVALLQSSSCHLVDKQAPRQQVTLPASL
jgi:hypothetical protein